MKEATIPTVIFVLGIVVVVFVMLWGLVSITALIWQSIISLQHKGLILV